MYFRQIFVLRLQNISEPPVSRWLYQQPQQRVPRRQAAFCASSKGSAEDIHIFHPCESSSHTGSGTFIDHLRRCHVRDCHTAAGRDDKLVVVGVAKSVSVDNLP